MPGTKISGEQTTSICTNAIKTVIRVSFGIKNKTPIMHSITAKIMNDAAKYREPIVLVVNARARGVAWLKPVSFTAPNQK